MMLNTNCAWARLKRGSSPRLWWETHQTTEAERAHQERPPAAASVPWPLPSSPPFRLANNLLVFPENLLLSSRQSEARDAIRLSVFVVTSLLGSYLLQILRHGSPALHGGRKKTRQFFSSTPLNCHEVSLYLQMQIHCWQSTDLEEGCQGWDPEVCNHIDVWIWGDIFFFRLLWKISFLCKILLKSISEFFSPLEGTFQPLSLENSQCRINSKRNVERI